MAGGGATSVPRELSPPARRRRRRRRQPGSPTGVRARAEEGRRGRGGRTARARPAVPAPPLPSFPATRVRPEPRRASLRRAFPPRSRPTESANVNTARGNGVWPPADPNALYGPRSRHSPRVSAVVATRVRAPRQWRSGGYLRTNQGVM